METQTSSRIDRCVLCSADIAGRRSDAKYCSARCQRLHRKRIWAARWREKNPDKRRDRDASIYANDRTRRQERARRYYAANREVYMWRARRRLIACPSWLTADQRRQISEVYGLAEKLNAGRRDFEVDHIVPLNGRNVCGMHVPWNLQVITRAENRAKHNSIPEIWMQENGTWKLRHPPV